MFRVATLDLYERRLDAPMAPPELPPGAELIVSEGLAAATLEPAWHGEAHARLRAGQTCAVVRAGGAVVGYCWSTTAPASVEEVRCRVVPAADEVYLYDAYTAPAWRGRRLFPAMLAALLDAARAQGRRRALIFVLASNRASRRAIERAGFRRFLAVTRVEVLGVGRLWVRGPRAARARLPCLRPG